MRALYRLCHLLNESGYRAAMGPPRAYRPGRAPWRNPVWWSTAAPEDAIVVYPEIIPGNPLRAKRVVRWCLNYPGLLAGDATFAKGELVLAWDARMLDRVSAAAGVTLDASHVLAVPTIDPEFIYPDPAMAKDIDCFFVYKGKKVRERFVLPNERELVCIDEHAPTLRDLGNLLRRTRRLYSYDHATLLFHEAWICGCELIQVHADGTLTDPRQCLSEQFACAEDVTTTWPAPDFVQRYAACWTDPAPARRFAEMATAVFDSGAQAGR